MNQYEKKIKKLQQISLHALTLTISNFMHEKRFQKCYKIATKRNENLNF